MIITDGHMSPELCMSNTVGITAPADGLAFIKHVYQIFDYDDETRYLIYDI